jgi:hypothetical protein
MWWRIIIAVQSPEMFANFHQESAQLSLHERFWESGELWEIQFADLAKFQDFALTSASLVWLVSPTRP